MCFTGALPQGEEPQKYSPWTAAAGSDLPISAAMGCAWAEGADKDLQQLLRQADDSMYGTKKKMKEHGT